MVLPFLYACTPSPRSIVASRFMENEFQHALVGTRCAVHPGVRLASDIVPIHYGIYYYEPAMELYPNAHRGWGGGCVSGRQRYTEVAYCWKCRIGQTRWMATESVRAMVRRVTQPRR